MMIPYSDFARLRLSAVMPDAEIAQLENWEFQNHLWIGEAIEFSEWLRLESDPDTLRSLAIDFSVFPEHSVESMLERLQLPVRRGMSLNELDLLLGKRVAEFHFASDRVTAEYFMPEPYRYRISCTVLNEGGLSYLGVMVPPIGDPE